MIAAIAFLFAAATSGWHDARAIVVPATQLPAYVRLELPQTIDGGTESSYAGVRVVDADGREVPYALDVDPEVSPGAAAQLSDVGFVPGQFTQAIADTGSSGTLRSAITVETTQPTFFEHVQIATSDDRRVWTVVTPDALIYRVASSDPGTSEVAYGPSRARWVRVRILNGAKPFPITGASFPAIAAPPQLVPLATTQSVRQSGTSTIVTFDFATPNTNLAAVGFAATTPQYSRDVVFERPASGESGWEQFANGQISTYDSQRRAETSTETISTGDRHLRGLRVTIQNGNDSPLAGLRLSPLGYSHHIIFRATAGGQYRLLWNNADAAAPVYDLGDILKHERWSVGAVATLGAVASTAISTSASSGTPWLQQAALPIALALLFVVLLVVALIAMRKKPES
ncbi:MAG TPA: DUF3999 family protein [Candidatus Acidoferrales bacterium]|nr:DUF3999 family protein [Candidatus Acidoferrales bacterium]